MLFKTEIVIQGCRVWLESDSATGKDETSRYAAQSTAETIREVFAYRYGYGYTLDPLKPIGRVS